MSNCRIPASSSGSSGDPSVLGLGCYIHSLLPQLSLSLSRSLSLYVSLTLSLYLRLSLSVSPFLSVSLCLCLSLSLSLSLIFSLIPPPPSFSLTIKKKVCVSVGRVTILIRSLVSLWLAKSLLTRWASNNPVTESL